MDNRRLSFHPCSIGAIRYLLPLSTHFQPLTSHISSSSPSPTRITHLPIHLCASDIPESILYRLSTPDTLHSAESNYQYSAPLMWWNNSSHLVIQRSALQLYQQQPVGLSGTAGQHWLYLFSPQAFLDPENMTMIVCFSSRWRPIIPCLPGHGIHADIGPWFVADIPQRFRRISTTYHHISSIHRTSSNSNRKSIHVLPPCFPSAPRQCPPFRPEKHS